MTLKYTANTLKKIEQLLEESRMRIRYEKGSFSSGYCLLENRKIAVINKFLNLEGRINALVEIVNQIPVQTEELSEEMRKLYRSLTKSGPDSSTENTLNFKES